MTRIQSQPSHAVDAFPDTERRGIYRAIHTRRDIRHFRDDPIPQAVLGRIIKAAHHGPSVGFMQPWDFILISDLAVRRQVKELFERERQAAACFFDEPRRSHYLSLKLEGILESPVNLCITCDPTRGEEVLGRNSIRERVQGTGDGIPGAWFIDFASSISYSWWRKQNSAWCPTVGGE